MTSSVVTKIQTEVISKYGFSPDGEGVIQFIQHVKLLERQVGQISTNICNCYLKFELCLKQYSGDLNTKLVWFSDHGYLFAR